MAWLVTAVMFVWLLPLIAAAGAALVYLASARFRAWFGEVLFGHADQRSQSPGINVEGVVRTAER